MNDAQPTQPWDGRTVAVTGAGGFFGSNLVRGLLEAGATVRAFVRYRSDGGIGGLGPLAEHPRLEVHRGDLRDKDSLPPLLDGADTLYHLGALISVPHSFLDPAAYLGVNATGTVNLLGAAREAGTGRIVAVSTSEVYGTAQTERIGEDHPLVAQSPYAASKIAAEKLCESFHHAYAAPVVTVRPFNLYGPGQSSRAVIPSIARQIVQSGVVRLGNTDAFRDFNYVDDTVDAMIKLGLAPAEKVVGRVFNIGSEESVSIKEVASLLQQLSGRDVVFEMDHTRIRPHTSEVHRLCADSERLRSVIGVWRRTSLEDGLRKVLDHESRTCTAAGSFV
ncbi:SDR family NAD(P)-dependent oxidoreductase [Streptomyces sp. MW-W600-10]|uniref:SDR family NAD(P)-dependent oxidoreductase n=1 Tax=Streptomyces sp. MW-W600-10 TaxID=2829819 RepID=UPI001C496AD9|nr:SDR family NAD(P)-dependent oxidoreductase [Streptomyces sp. MW-W600-10]MBV7245823.1 SDR family NAD(P)-dependent oxidoreductase [Streptomyces sp. MW-W600-10]